MCWWEGVYLNSHLIYTQGKELIGSEQHYYSHCPKAFPGWLQVQWSFHMYVKLHGRYVDRESLAKRCWEYVWSCILWEGCGQSHNILDRWHHTLDFSCIVPRAALFESLLWWVQILPTAADSDWIIRHSHSSALQQWVGWGHHTLDTSNLRNYL